MHAIKKKQTQKNIDVLKEILYHPIATIRIPDKYICATYVDVCVLNENASYTIAILKDAGAWRGREPQFQKEAQVFAISLST